MNFKHFELNEFEKRIITKLCPDFVFDFREVEPAYFRDFYYTKIIICNTSNDYVGTISSCTFTDLGESKIPLNDTIYTINKLKQTLKRKNLT